MAGFCICIASMQASYHWAQGVNQMPESSWNVATSGQWLLELPNHLFQLSHTRLISCNRARVSCWAASCRSRICKAKPDDACNAIWQCISQTPGLSALKAMTMYPPAGSKATSLRGGLSNFRFRGILLLLDCCSRAKSWPWRWIYGDVSY